MGQVRRHRHRRSDAARARAGVRGPLGQRHLASPGSEVRRVHVLCCEPSAARGDPPPWSSTPPPAGSSRNGSSSTATSPRSRTSTGTAACSWATHDGRTHLLDAESLLPEGDGFEFAAHVSTPIGDGSTAMVHEFSGDGASVHWRVIDVSTGDVLSEGDLDLRRERLGCLSGRLDGRRGREDRRDRRPSTSRPETSGGDPTGLGAEVLWLDYSDDGELLVSGAADGGVSLWDATTLDLLGTVYPPHRGRPGPGRRAVHRRQPRRGHRVVRRPGLPVGDRPRPGHRLRVPDGRPEPDRRGVGRVPARPALPVRLPRRVRGGPVPASTSVTRSDWAAETRSELAALHPSEAPDPSPRPSGRSDARSSARVNEQAVTTTCATFTHAAAGDPKSAASYCARVDVGSMVREDCRGEALDGDRAPRGDR